MGQLSLAELEEISFYNFSNAITACYFTDQNFVLRKVNDIFRSLFPVGESLIGKNFCDVLSQIGMPEETIVEYKKQMQNHGRVNIAEFQVNQQDSIRYFSLFSTKTTFPSLEVLNGVQGQFIDRTEEVLLKLRQENLADQIRHDMKNRISVIKTSCANLLVRQELLSLDESVASSAVNDYLKESEKTLNLMNQNSDFLAAMVSEILDSSKLQAGKLTLRTINLEVKSLIEEIIQVLQSQQEALKIKVNLVVPKMQIAADKLQLSRMIENLYSNALKYAKSEVTLTAATEEGHVVFSFIDDGIGLIPEDLTLIFEPFYQVKGEEKVGSTGLGLDSVKKLAELHLGECWAESDGPGQGSRFYLKIPQNLLG
ncbi:MAG: HAMP domain-containing sensor histidine kinase [SAR324 cluster bacterium]|nr:HAMP domain-containing sensor histidine kinase [SAR324 cluster bacterium]